MGANICKVGVILRSRVPSGVYVSYDNIQEGRFQELPHYVVCSWSMRFLFLFDKLVDSVESHVSTVL